LRKGYGRSVLRRSCPPASKIRAERQGGTVEDKILNLRLTDFEKEGLFEFAGISLYNLLANELVKW
jgi:hypothetical protein